jgi:hypothetical protein
LHAGIPLVVDVFEDGEHRAIQIVLSVELQVFLEEKL